MSITSPTARALAALGHDTRLAIFRLLVRAGDDGLNVGDIGQHLDQAPSTLAHHLSALVDAGLVVQERQGRTVINRTLDFLTSECCTGVKLAKTETETAA